MILKESELHHSIGDLIDGAHPGPKTDRDYLGQYCPKTFEMAKGKKEKSSNSNAPDNLYRSSDMSEPHLSGSLCCDEARFFRNHKHTQQLSPTNKTTLASTHMSTLAYTHAPLMSQSSTERHGISPYLEASLL